MTEETRKKLHRFRLIIRGLLMLAVLLTLAIALGLGYLTINEYTPDAIEFMESEGEGTATLTTGQPLTLLSWNIGYAGLGEEADFFMDGGKNVTSYDEDGVKGNLSKIISELQAEDPDIIMLQETDVDSARTYGINEKKEIQSAMAGYESNFAYNYKANYVPYPVPPIGRVGSGILTLTKCEQKVAERISLPCPFAWPIRTANLKRCLLVSYIPLENSEKELVIINLHLEAYDSGAGKIAQTRELMAIFQSEVDKGNYVIAGGDFNQTFSGIDLASSCAPLIDKDYWQPGIIEEDQFTDFAEMYMDSETPSCRSLDKALAGNEDTDFQYYIIDGFIVSKNITVDNFEALDLGFEASDHNPVTMTITLNDSKEN